MRRKGGNFDHPTALHFLYRSRHLLTTNLMNFCAESNCEADSDALLIPADILQADEDNGNTSANLIIDESLLDVDDVISKVDTSALDDPFQRKTAAFVGSYLLVTNKSLTQSSIFLNYKEFDNVKHGLHIPQQI